MSTCSPDEDEFISALATLPRHALTEDTRRRHLSMLAELAPARRQPQRRRRIALTAIAATILAGGLGVGAAAAFGVFSAPPTDRSIAHCYTTADLKDPANREDIAVAVPGDSSNPSLEDAASHAMNICRGGWLQGRYSSTDPKILLDPKPAPWDYPIPPLVACVLKNGQVGVFPGTLETCGSLNLPVAEI